jgi:hypothetical protein
MSEKKKNGEKRRPRVMTLFTFTLSLIAFGVVLFSAFNIHKHPAYAQENNPPQNCIRNVLTSHSVEAYLIGPCHVMVVFNPAAGGAVQDITWNVVTDFHSDLSERWLDVCKEEGKLINTHGIEVYAGHKEGDKVNMKKIGTLGEETDVKQKCLKVDPVKDGPYMRIKTAKSTPDFTLAVTYNGIPANAKPVSAR